MNRESNIDKILQELIKSGSKIDYLKKLREQSLKIVKKDIGLDEALARISREIKEQTKKFLNEKNIYDINYITGISCLIYLPNFENNGEYKLKLIGGKTNRSKSLKIDTNTLFDIDSITRLYTLILLFKLEKEGLINFDLKINDINPDFRNLKNLTLNDLIMSNIGIGINSNITHVSSKDEFYEILKTLEVEVNAKEKNNFVYAVISNIIEKVISKKMGEDITFEDIMYEYLLNPLNLYQTEFNPITNNLSGNGNKRKQVYNQNYRMLGASFGNAGLFVSSEDLAKLSKSLYRVNFYNRGLIRKTQLDCLGNDKIKEFSKGSFLYQGATGSIATFDPNNFIHQNILVNSIYTDEDKNRVENDKPIGYMDAFDEYYKQIVKNTMLMYVVKEYYNKYCNEKEDIEVIKYI